MVGSLRAEVIVADSDVSLTALLNRHGVSRLIHRWAKGRDESNNNLTGRRVAKKGWRIRLVLRRINLDRKFDSVVRSQAQQGPIIHNQTSSINVSKGMAAKLNESAESDQPKAQRRQEMTGRQNRTILSIQELTKGAFQGASIRQSHRKEETIYLWESKMAVRGWVGKSNSSPKNAWAL